MSKYIIDLRPDCKVVQQICVSDENVGVGARSVELFDALTDDYVKENFKDLLEGEYQRGLEDGKKEAESSEVIEQAKVDAFNKGMLHKGEKIHDAYQRGLDDAWEAARKIAAMWETMDNDDLLETFGVTAKIGEFVIGTLFKKQTANEAMLKLEAYEEKQKADDEIKVGDEVKPFYTDITGLVTLIDGDTIYVLWRDGSSTSTLKLKEVVKTGRHFDITKILEDMKHD